MTPPTSDGALGSRVSSIAVLIGQAVGYGAACLGLLGAIVGLVIGLLAYPPTAWFGVIELGLLSAAAGAVLGAIVGALVAALHRFSDGGRPTSTGSHRPGPSG